MSQSVHAVVVDPASPEGLIVRPVELPPVNRNEVTVRVTAISLNRGEVRRATSQGKPGDRPGWDFAGIVEESAPDGSGPQPEAGSSACFLRGPGPSASVPQAIAWRRCRRPSRTPRPRPCRSPD